MVFWFSLLNISHSFFMPLTSYLWNFYLLDSNYPTIFYETNLYFNEEKKYTSE